MIGVPNYRLNVELFQVCTVLMNVCKWQGILELASEVPKHKARLKPEVFDFITNGVKLIGEGTLPELRDFLLCEEIEIIKMQDADYDLLADLRLSYKFIGWIQEREFDNHLTLLQLLEDEELSSRLRNWCQMNEYDTELTYEQSISMTTEEWLALRDSNTVVKEHYEKVIEEAMKNVDWVGPS